MDLAFNEQQEMLRKSARSFLSSKCPKEYVREMEQDEKGYSPRLWQEMAQLGWIGLAFPEEYGGSGMSLVDLAVLLEEMGRACLPGPFFSTVLLGGLTILDAGSEEQKREFLPLIAQGKMIATLALMEISATYMAADISTRAVAEDDRFVIGGTKMFVPDANVADYIICVARTRESAVPEDGVTLFLMDARSPGISLTQLRSIALDKQCEVVLNNVKVPKEKTLGEMDKGWAEVEKGIERAAVAKCAEMVGGAQQVLEMSTSYAKERVQFAHPIGSFQAIQHHLANAAIDVDGARLVTYRAAWMLSEGLPCLKEVAVTKAWTSEAYKRIVAIGHQIHGGNAFMEDHDMQLYFRRAKAAELAFGDAYFHQKRIATLLGIAPDG